MKEETQSYKRQFLWTIRPFLDMLEKQRLDMNYHDWLKVVHRTKSSMTLSPNQYLGQNLPTQEITVNIIKEIFDDFVQAQLSVPAENEAH